MGFLAQQLDIYTDLPEPNSRVAETPLSGKHDASWK